MNDQYNQSQSLKLIFHDKYRYLNINNENLKTLQLTAILHQIKIELLNTINDYIVANI